MDCVSGAGTRSVVSPSEPSSSSSSWHFNCSISEQNKFLYLCGDGCASSIHACVCLCSTINVECCVLLGEAADVEALTVYMHEA